MHGESEQAGPALHFDRQCNPPSIFSDFRPSQVASSWTLWWSNFCTCYTVNFMCRQVWFACAHTGLRASVHCLRPLLQGLVRDLGPPRFLARLPASKSSVWLHLSGDEAAQIVERHAAALESLNLRYLGTAAKRHNDHRQSLSALLGWVLQSAGTSTCQFIKRNVMRTANAVSIAYPQNVETSADWSSTALSE